MVLESPKQELDGQIAAEDQERDQDDRRYEEHMVAALCAARDLVRGRLYGGDNATQYERCQPDEGGDEFP